METARIGAVTMISGGNMWQMAWRRKFLKRLRVQSGCGAQNSMKEYELVPEDPPFDEVVRRVIFLEVVGSDKWLIELNPPIPEDTFSSNPNVVQRAVLMARWVGYHLVPDLSHDPIFVNLLLPKEGAELETGPWGIQQICELRSIK